MNKKKIVYKIGKILMSIFTVLMGTVSVLLSQAIVWMFDTWKNLTMEELVYQLNAPAEGTNMDYVYDFIYKCVPGTILVFFLAIILVIGLRKTKKSFWISSCFVLIVSIVSLLFFGTMLWTKLDISNYLANKNTYSVFIDSNYVEPSDVEIIFPEEKRNLIYIYLESMETTYASLKNGGAFEDECISELVQISQDNEDFSGNSKKINGAYTMPGATWTIGAIFAHTSGLPLQLPFEGNDMESQESFFPTIMTLGDILEDAGYEQVFLCGSDITFGGRKLYLESHGDYKMMDYYYAIQQGYIPENYAVWWGYEDKYLFEIAKSELLGLAQEEKPFNFTILTADTHFEDGYVCSDCGTEHGDDQYANVMSCSSRKVKEFIEWIQQQDFYENTTIVICGDHLTMDGDFCINIDENYERRTYTAYVNAAAEVEDESLVREYTTFDYYPTTLASLGVEIEGNRLGLGTNLFSSRLTLLEEYGYDTMAREIKKESELMNTLASTLSIEIE